MPSDYNNRLIFLDCSTGGPGAYGKMNSNWFFPRFRKALEGSGVEVERMRFTDFSSHIQCKDQSTVILLNYGEDHDIAKAEHWRTVTAFFEELVEYGWKGRVLHPPNIGATIVDKRETAQFLAPSRFINKEVPGEYSEYPVFSAAPTGTTQPTFVVPAGEKLDPERFNTQLVDTRYSYRGVPYHVSLRAMAVGSICTAIFVRARPAAEGTPNVHTTDTPRDVDLLNYLYGKLVLPNLGEILNLCRHVETKMGLGFYAHDILPCAKSSRLVLCETGFKFDEFTVREYFAGLPNMVFGNDAGSAACSLAAQAFLAEAIRIGFFKGEKTLDDPSFENRNSNFNVRGR